MSKDTYIRTRIQESTKNDFETICNSMNLVPSEQLRFMIEMFVADNHGSENNPYKVHIYKPEDYDYGVWRVTVTLKTPSDGEWMGAPIPFELPDLPYRIIQSDPEYRAVVARRSDGMAVLGGRFDNGFWRGHVRTNGREESTNPISIEQVEEAIREVLDKAFKNFHQYGKFEIEQKKREEQYKDARNIVEWIQYKLIWTKNAKLAISGDVTPGIYGLNIVEGYCDSFEGGLYVISRNISGAKGHVDRHHLYITKYDDWIKYMIKVEMN